MHIWINKMIILFIYTCKSDLLTCFSKYNYQLKCANTNYNLHILCKLNNICEVFPQLIKETKTSVFPPDVSPFIAM